MRFTALWLRALLPRFDLFSSSSISVGFMIVSASVEYIDLKAVSNETLQSCYGHLIIVPHRTDPILMPSTILNTSFRVINPPSTPYSPP